MLMGIRAENIPRNIPAPRVLRRLLARPRRATWTVEQRAEQADRDDQRAGYRFAGVVLGVIAVLGVIGLIIATKITGG